MRILPKDPNTREISDAVNQAAKGNLNNTGTVTLTANVTSTTVIDTNVHNESKIFLTPQTSNAASESWYIQDADITNGQFIITHANAASTDRTFQYSYLG